MTNSDVASYDVLVGGSGGTVTSSVASLAIGGIPSSVLNSNLVAYLTFDADYLDYSGRQNHPSSVNTNSRTTGFLGAGSYVLTNSGYLSFGLAPDLHFNNDTIGNTNSFSISFWAKIPANSYTGAPPFVANKDWSADGNTGWALAAGAGVAGNGFFTMQFKESNANSRRYDSVSTALTNGWHHYLVVHQRNGTRTCFTYIDGALADSRAMFASGINLDGASLPLNLGQDGTGTGTRGRWNAGAQMDDFALWRRALTATDVTAIYSAGTNGYALAYAETAPVITNFPASFTLSAGSNLSLTVSVISATPPAYQWRLNGTNLTGATSATYLKIAPAATNFGSYDVIVTNLYGSTASAVVVVSPPAPAIGLVNAISYTGGNAVTLNFAGTAGVSYDVQRSTNLVNWATIWTTNAPVGGLFNFTDNFIGNAPRQAFYRLTWLP